MTLRDDYLDHLAMLVNRDCGTRNTAGVTAVAEDMKKLFDSIGWETTIVDLGPNAGHGLIAKNKPGSDTCDVIFNAHLDTVFPDGEAAKRPFKIEGDRAYGPGCSDCKSGVLAIWYAAKLARQEDLDRLSVWCVFNPDEELGSPSSMHWLEECAGKAKAALVFEAARAGGQLVRSRKGVATYRVSFKGVSAHAGNNPWDGCNANVAAMRFALAAYDLADQDRGTTVNPGLIQGGTGSNIISDAATVTCDLRYWNDEDGNELEAGIKALAEKTWVEGVTQEYVRVSHSPAMPYSPDTKALVEKIDAAALEAGFTAEWVDAGGGSDGNHMAVMGIPVVDGCGPAGGGFHCDKEFLRLDTIEERIHMIVNLLKRL